MHRRQFLQWGITPAVAGLAAERVSSARPGVAAPDGGAPPVMRSYTQADHRRRLENIARCEQSIRGCLRRHLITDYLPGQVCYNLGEYPSRKRWSPDERDEVELDRLRDSGVRLIQTMEEWNDLLRLFGGTKLSAINPDGLRRFVDMVHKRGMKLLLYASTGYFQRTDPDFREEWARPGGTLKLAHWNMARCSPASPGWRAYLLPRIARILDEYGADGLYNDFGYLPLYRNPKDRTPDEVLAMEETPEHDAALEDLLSIVYSEVRRRGGIYKVHQDGALCPKTISKVYDYLWVGEGESNADKVRENVKNHPPYVVPCLDMGATKIDSEDDKYLHSIPYMQFPLLLAGRPFTAERVEVPGVKYYSGPWEVRWREMLEFYRAHPHGPYSYGPWDSFPGNPETRPTHARWLKRYLNLVEDGTRAYLEIHASTLFPRPLPNGVVASAFANRDLWMVLANYNRASAEVEIAEPYVDPFRAGSPAQAVWALAPRSLLILRRPSKAA